MNDVEAYNCIMWLDSMEDRLVNFCRIVPPQSQNETTWSPMLAEVIIEASSIVDSLFCHVGGSHTAASDRNWKLPDYHDKYESELRLSQRKLVLLSTPPKFLSPFQGWTREYSPGWWKTHNKLKHDRLKHMSEAHLSLAINAAGGAFAVFCAFAEEHASLLRALMRHESLSSYNQNSEILLKKADEKVLRRYLGTRPIWSVSKLFAVMLGGQQLPDSIEDFRPAVFNGGSKLIEFFGRL